jgi:hypothetical protein
MTAPHEVPEQAFPLQPTAQQDTLLHLQSLQQQLAACSAAAAPSQHTSSSAAAAAAVLTPGLPKLYSLLEETYRTMPGHSKQQVQQQQQGHGLDVGSIMQEALRKCNGVAFGIGPGISSCCCVPCSGRVGTCTCLHCGCCGASYLGKTSSSSSRVVSRGLVWMLLTSCRRLYVNGTWPSCALQWFVDIHRAQPLFMKCAYICMMVTGRLARC